MTARANILAGLAAAGLYLGASITAMAQSAGDPPGRVGRLAQISGTVSFHTAQDNQWTAATLNYPITSGNSLWTEPRSHAAVDVGSSRLYLDGSTELDIGTLDDQHFIASLPQGAVYVRVYADAGGQYEIDTPRGQVQISQPGNYEIIAGDADHPTAVTVYQGLAEVAGQAGNMSVGPGQSASITGQDNQLQGAIGQAPPLDDFIQFVQDEERPYANQPAQPPQQYGSPGMTGYQDLAQYGAWQSTPDYGPVWYPQVAAGWAPYRYGHWAYVWPWGWTWIDDARWGFAPFHYGRWLDYGGRWGWVPGAYERAPVYAPALVAFFGNFGGIGVGIAIGQAVGWVPLGPGEICYPGYRASPDYMRRMNVAYIHNTTIINYNYYNAPRGSDFGQYRNHVRGATMVSSDDMLHSRSIGQAWKRTPQGGSSAPWQHAKSYGGQAPIKPSYATVGVTAGTARQIGVVGTAPPAGTHSPGPQIHQYKRLGANGQGGNNGQGQTGGQGQAGGQNNLTGTGHGTTTFTVPPKTGTTIKGANAPGPATPNNGGNTQLYKGTVAPGPTIPTNNGTGTQAGQNGQTGGNQSKKPKSIVTGTPGPTIPTNNGTGIQAGQNGQTGGNQSKKPKSIVTGTPGPTIPTNNGTGTQAGQNSQTGGNQSKKPKNYYQGGTTGNAGSQGGTLHQNFGTGQGGNAGTQGGQNGAFNSNAGNGTSGQQHLNPQNGQIQSGNVQPRNYGNTGSQGQLGNSHNVQSGTAPKLPPPPPPPSSKCKAGQKCT